MPHEEVPVEDEEEKVVAKNLAGMPKEQTM